MYFGLPLMHVSTFSSKDSGSNYEITVKGIVHTKHPNMHGFLSSAENKHKIRILQNVGNRTADRPHCFCSFSLLWKSVRNIDCSVTHISQNIFFCVFVICFLRAKHSDI